MSWSKWSRILNDFCWTWRFWPENYCDLLDSIMLSRGHNLELLSGSSFHVADIILSFIVYVPFLCLGFLYFVWNISHFPCYSVLKTKFVYFQVNSNILIQNCFFQKMRCQRKEPCRLFTVKKRPDVEEVSTNTLCQCPHGHHCPQHHSEPSVISSPSSFTEEHIRTYSGYCTSEVA